VREALVKHDPRTSKDEFVNRTMDRLMATATYGPQPKRPTEQTVLTVKGSESGRDVSVAMTASDIEAIFAEFALEAPCGICHHDPCIWSMEP
jgi:hypothetical protein